MTKVPMGGLIAMILALALVVSCSTFRFDNPRVRGPVISTSTFTTETVWLAGEPARMMIDWGTTGTGPYVIVVDLGGGGLDAPGDGMVTSPYTYDFMLREGGPFTWVVIVTDANGYTTTATGTFGPVGPQDIIPAQNSPPEIESVLYAASVLTVTVSDAEGDDVTVTVSDIVGLDVDNNSVTVVGGNGDAVFTWVPTDPIAGGTGTTTINAFDADHAAEPVVDSATILYSGWIAPQEGHLWAIPMATTATIGETVTILVVSGDFPEDAAFNYMNGVSVTFNEGVDYVAESMNVGSLGGDTHDIDGIWANMNPAPTTFFILEMYLHYFSPVIGADPPQEFINFNLTPIGAGEVTGGGDLFNFGVTFDHAGTYDIGFLEFQDIKRTYYSDNAAVEHNWLDISNDIQDITTTITVTE